MKQTTGHIDWYILISVIGLMLFSIAFVYTASANVAELKFGDSEKLFISHLIKIFIGIGTILLFSKIDYHKWLKYSKPFLFVAVIGLVAVLAGGSTFKGASRWLDLGFVSFQPSELAKFAMIIHFAAMLSRKQANIKNFETGFLPFMLWTVLICLLIALQPNFSTMIMIYLISMIMLFIGNANILHLITTFLLGLVASGIYMISADYRMNRLMGFFGFSSEETAAEAVNYQLNQALIAIGNGGFSGVGVGQSRQSHLFLPESYGDFIFSIIGEEYGFIGTLFILCVFLVIFVRGLIIAKKAPDLFGYYLSLGIIVTFAIYVIINAGVNTGLFPTTGVPMPFVSYGGTAVIFYSAAIGILLNVSAQAGVYHLHSNVEPEENEELESDAIPES